MFPLRDLLHEFHAGHSRHLDVGDDYLRTNFPAQFYGLLAVLRVDYFVFALEIVLDNLFYSCANQFVVVCDYYRHVIPPPILVAAPQGIGI